MTQVKQCEDICNEFIIPIFFMSRAIPKKKKHLLILDDRLSRSWEGRRTKQTDPKVRSRE